MGETPHFAGNTGAPAGTPELEEGLPLLRGMPTWGWALGGLLLGLLATATLVLPTTIGIGLEPKKLGGESCSKITKTRR